MPTRVCFIALRYCFIPLLVVLASACTSIPHGKLAVTDFEIEGNDRVSDSDIRDQLATKKTRRFAGLVLGLMYDYELFNYPVLGADLARIERYYRARGFYRARALAARVRHTTDRRVEVQVQVYEGPPTLVSRLEWDGIQPLPAPVRQAAVVAFNAGLAVGDTLTEAQLEQAAEETKRRLMNLGYAHAQVHPVALVDMPTDRALVRIEVQAGPKVTLGEIRITGLGRLPEEPVRVALGLKPGDPYSPAALREAQQAVIDLGVFSDARVEALIEDGTVGAPVPVVVSLTRAPLRELSLGAGIRLDLLRSDVHGVVNWQHRNFLGGLRRFTIGVSPGLVFYPTRISNFVVPEQFLPEVSNLVRLEQPGFLEARTRGWTQLTYDIFAVLIQVDPPPDAPVIGFQEGTVSLGLDRRFWKLMQAVSYNFQANVPFAYSGELIDGAVPVFLSFIEARSTLDLRDDSIRPTRGVQLSLVSQFAGLGGDARDVRLEPSARFHIPIEPGVAGLAFRVSTGFLFPFNYETSADANVSIQDSQISYFRSLFSGGPSSNRGYPYRGVGPAGAVPFFNPAIEEQLVRDLCVDSSPDYDPRNCQTPLGGQTLWELSAELRLQFTQALSGAVFCDASDVELGRMHFVFARPHLSCGVGPRYDTPVGPIRLDIAYRIPGLQTLDSGGRIEADPGDILGFPINISLGVGEAF